MRDGSRVAISVTTGHRHGISMRKKSDLPTKTCLHCGRPFTWRKKWERVWEEVKYCSDRCRNERRSPTSRQT